MWHKIFKHGVDIFSWNMNNYPSQAREITCQISQRERESTNKNAITQYIINPVARSRWYFRDRKRNASLSSGQLIKIYSNQANRAVVLPDHKNTNQSDAWNIL